jgi:hypothetical protein
VRQLSLLSPLLLGLVVGPGCSSRASAPSDLGRDRPQAHDLPLLVDASATDGGEGGCITLPEPATDLPILPDLAPPDAPPDAPTDAPPDAAPDIDAAGDGPVLDVSADVATDVAVDVAADVVVDAPAPDQPVPDAPTPDLPTPCPTCMVLIDNTFCMDLFEASRPDATYTSQGTSTAKAMCVQWVIPWYSYTLTKSEAANACAAAGKRLCTPTEWKLACSGTKNKVYAYGNTYTPLTCNGIDTFCYCGAGTPCANVSPCPYPHCFNMPPPSGTPVTGCGAWLHPTPTGAFPYCVDEWGVYDLNGNVWELVDTSDGLLHFRGGAYNCGDSETLHRCDYDAIWSPSAQGFRCCKDPLFIP